MGKDVWFIRTPEGMRAQINDEVSRAKMRVLIVAPSLVDLDLPSLMAAPKFVNIRLSCSIDVNDPSHQQILDQLGSRANITVRHRELQNLWGINRDYEEIILGIIGETPTEEGAHDVAAIGSILQEHIRILVPILEDAWMGSRKDYGYQAQEVNVPVAGGVSPNVPAAAASARQAAQAREKMLEREVPKLAPAPRRQFLRRRPTVTVPDLATVPPPADDTPPLAAEKRDQPFSAAAARQAAQARAEAMERGMPKPEPTAPRRQFLRRRSTTKTPEPSMPEETAPLTSDEISEITASLQDFFNKFESFPSGKECADALIALRDFILQQKGFSTVLNDMKHWADQLRHEPWDARMQAMLKKRVDAWTEKLLQ